MTVDTLGERLWPKINIKGKDECWPFLGSKNELGYGQIWNSTEKRLMKAHKAAYVLTYGLTDAPVFRHTCDNPPCCNPHHILPGTMKQNSQDMIERGRHYAHFNTELRGEKHPSTIYSDELKLKIALDTRSHRQVSAHYGVSKSHVTRIKKAHKEANAEGGNW